MTPDGPSHERFFQPSRDADSPWFVVAEEGGGGAVNVNRRTDGPWERFTVVVVR